jgi:hypothetical protein
MGRGALEAPRSWGLEGAGYEESGARIGGAAPVSEFLFSVFNVSILSFEDHDMAQMSSFPHVLTVSHD